jgi:basic amino acid/polyamine antiporter, APA family
MPLDSLFWQQLTRRKPLETDEATGLCRTLGALDLLLYGVGSSVGAGIYVLVGLGARIAGPAIALSFALCGAACMLTSLAYADFAARIPLTGSAFTYAYVAFGEIWAWVIGWNLILGYGFTTSVVARAWADYVGDFMGQWRDYKLANFIHTLAEVRVFGDAVDYSCSPLSMILIGMNTMILLRGVQDSSLFSNIMTILNVLVLAMVVVSGWFTESVHVDNLTPFMPHHFSSVIQGAGLVFFAFIGFDMVASLSEEVVNPGRNMPIGIVGSLMVSSTIYISVAITVVGMTPIPLLGESVPVVSALMANACCTHSQQLLDNAAQVCLEACAPDSLDHRAYVVPILAKVGRLVSVGAIMGLMASSFTSLMGQPRIFYKMAQDGLWFSLFAEVDPVTHVPRQGIIVTGFCAALMACLAPLGVLANLISLGTLMVFTFVDGGVVLLRVRQNVTSKSPHVSSQSLETRVAGLLAVYTIAVTLASMLYAQTMHEVPGSHANVSLTWYQTWAVWACLIVMLLTAIRIVILVPNETDQTQASPTFTCPMVPLVPLAGIACNAFMMGSLPLMSWILCFFWLMGGILFYFVYGIHHSVLNNKATNLPLSVCSSSTSSSPENTPLLGNNTDMSYESTLSLSMHEVHRN